MADPGRHPDVERLDDYADGYQPSLDVERHVRGCAACQEVVEALRRVRVELAGLAKMTMPADVATRIHAALEAENAAAGLSGAGRPGAGRTHKIPVAPGTLGHAGPGHRRRVRIRTLELLAAAAACLVALATVTGILITRGDTREATTSAAGSAAAKSENYLSPSTTTGQDGSGGRSAPDAVPPGAADARRPTAATAAPQAPAAQVTAVTVAATDSTIAGDELDRHANDLLAGRASGGAARWPVHLEDPDDPLATPALPSVTDVPLSARTWAAIQELTGPSLASCYRVLTKGNGGAVLAVDLVRFGGQPSAFVVLSIPNTAELVHVWIINIDCGTSGTAMARRADKIVQRS